jgi:hypothetical protein
LPFVFIAILYPHSQPEDPIATEKLRDAIANHTPMSTDITPPCTPPPASRFIGEMAYAIRYGLCTSSYPHPPFLTEKTRGCRAWAEEFRPTCQVSTSLSRFFLPSCLQNRSATSKLICDSQTHGKSVLRPCPLRLRSAVVIIASRYFFRAQGTCRIDRPFEAMRICSSFELRWRISSSFKLRCY